MTAVVVWAPPCPDWCTTKHGPDGWDDLGPANVAKLCHVEYPTQIDGCAVVVQRYADLADGRIEIEPAEIGISGHVSGITPEQVEDLAATLVEAAKLARTGSVM